MRGEQRHPGRVSSIDSTSGTWGEGEGKHRHPERVSSIDSTSGTWGK